MDEPSQILGGSHRRERQDVDSLDTAVSIFGDKYERDVVRQVFLDHLLLDSKEKENKPPATTEPYSLYTPDQPKTLFGLNLPRLLFSLDAVFGIGYTVAILGSVLNAFISGDIGFIMDQPWLYPILFIVFCFIVAIYYWKKWQPIYYRERFHISLKKAP